MKISARINCSPALSSLIAIILLITGCNKEDPAVVKESKAEKKSLSNKQKSKKSSSKSIANKKQSLPHVKRDPKPPKDVASPVENDKTDQRVEALVKIEIAIANTMDMKRKEVLQKILRCAENNRTRLGLRIENLTEFAPEIGLLKNLRRLTIYSKGTKKGVKEETKQLPLEICNLTNLEELTLKCNLTTLPSEIGQLTKLTDLSLRSNQLSKLPSEIGKLKKLETISFYDNELQELPKEITQLTQLKYLDLGYNDFSKFPAYLLELKQLEYLYLELNNLTSLPAEIAKHKKLKHLDIKENPLNEASLKLAEKFPPSEPEMDDLPVIIKIGQKKNDPDDEKKPSLKLPIARSATKRD